MAVQSAEVKKMFKETERLFKEQKAKDDGFFVLQKKGDIMVEEHSNIKSY